MATVLPFDAAGIHLDPAQGLARQLYAALRERILDGRLGSRTRMPASRELAQALKVSRNTVVRAYEQLHAEGYIDGRTGDGTYVAELQEIPGRAPAVALSAPAPRGPAALAPPPEGAPRAFRV
ncbi:TPA: winged helix-turn-helix transcriptional regulator, partial [Pseudomonas aeruginosa]|nr:winged helix-turn-helix transcriptional regulator [Pseudomonas aeruginosa]